MTSNLTTINQNSKLALAKSKSLLDITNKILSHKDIKDLVQSFSYKPFLMENGHGSAVLTLAIITDRKQIISGSLDGTIKIWSFQNGECLKTLKGHTKKVVSLATTPDGKHIISGSWDHTIKIWDIQTEECLETLNEHNNFISSIAITPDGEHIISGSWDHTIKIWNIQSGECIKTLEGHRCFVMTLVITPDGKHIVTGGWDHTLKIWNIQSGECIKTLDGHTNEVWAVAISPDGEHIVSGSKDETIKIWNIQTGECTRTLKGNEDSTILALAITPSGNYIVSGNSNNNIKIWNIKNGECLKTLEGHSRDVWEVVITQDGKHIVSGSNDKTIKIWNIQTGECTYTIDDFSRVSIDKNGYFTADNESIEKYIRVSEAPLTQRKLTAEEIKHFRKKGNFLEIGEIIPKQKFFSVMEAKEVPSPKPHAPITRETREVSIPSGVWLDPETKLMWQDDEDAKTVRKPWVMQSNYDAGSYMDTSGDTAATYASNLSLGGYNDWRLPTIDELRDLYEKKSKLKNVSSRIYWSSTTDEDYKHDAWVVNFYGGLVSDSDNKGINNYYVRCVRAGQ